MEIVLPVSVDNFHAKLDNYINKKYDQVVIKYLKKKVNECQTTIPPMQ